MSFSFGTPSSAPATAGLTGGFNFGANKPATPGFGLTATSQPSSLFGSTQPEQQSGALPGFGATTTPGFGAATPAFGTGTPAFGATSTAPAFGTTTPGFGATAAPSFGATTTPALGASAAPGFGATTTPSFGASGLNTSGLGTGGLNFGGSTNTSAPGTGLSFGAPAATTAAPGLGGGFSFGGTTTQSTGFGLFNNSTAATTTTSSLFGKLGTTSITGTLPSTSATPSFGLGGVATATSGIGTTNSSADVKSEPPKQNKLPNEISTTVDSFKEFVKKQKALSSEIMRVSIKPLHTVSRSAEVALRSSTSLGGAVRRARAQSRRLRTAAAGALAAAEAAARDYTQQGHGSELEGTAPPQYVTELISELEQQLITFRRQMDVADKQMQSSPKLLSEQELTLGMRRMHESLVALAGRLQAVHAQVEGQKEQYLNLRKYILKDPTNVFDAPNPTTSLDQILRDADTNRKKLKSGTMADMSQGSAVLSDPRAALGNLQHLAGPTPFTYVGTTLSPFPTVADNTGISWPTACPVGNTSQVSGPLMGEAAPSFQLQKPPGKRGKQ